ncbi:MAG: hypothetical protein OXR66_06210 [Candidatus Woesearchaeota archaeon]|nr:hypothetical protein [Candidatus Woesearchaeota archaeon]
MPPFSRLPRETGVMLQGQARAQVALNVHYSLNGEELPSTLLFFADTWVGKGRAVRSEKGTNIVESKLGPVARELPLEEMIEKMSDYVELSDGYCLFLLSSRLQEEAAAFPRECAFPSGYVLSGPAYVFPLADVVSKEHTSVS